MSLPRQSGSPSTPSPVRTPSLSRARSLLSRSLSQSNQRLGRALLCACGCAQECKRAREEGWVNLGVAYGTGMRELVVGLEGEPFWLLAEVRCLNTK
jgi:hypothetical protein